MGIKIESVFEPDVELCRSSSIKEKFTSLLSAEFSAWKKTT